MLEKKNLLWLGFFALAAGLRPAGLGSGLFVPGVAAQGMGGAHAGLGGEELDSLASPALAAYQEDWGAALGYGWLLDGATHAQTAALALPPDWFTLGLALDAQRLEDPATGLRELVAHLGAGLPLSSDGHTAIGGGLRWVQVERGVHGAGLGLDLGISQRWRYEGHAFLASAGLQDLDTVLHFDNGLDQRQQQVLRLGLGWRSPEGYALDLDQDAELASGSTPGRYTLRLGAEALYFRRQLALRLGYLSYSALSAVDPFGGSNNRLTAGLGLRLGRVGLDYAYVPSSGALGASHRLELSLGPALDVAKARAAAADPLKVLRVMRGDGVALLEWEDPSAAGVEGYTVLSSFRPDALYQRLADTGGGQTAMEIRGLDNGVQVYFKVAPLDAARLPVSAALSLSSSAKPEAPQGEVAASLEAARESYLKGDWDGAEAGARSALALDPQQADAELLLQRIAKLRPKEGRP